jgi:4-aminobutyrate aminotransferase-like enzyme
MGNGHPIAAVVTRGEMASAFSKADGYFNTFGGNPVSAAAALAVLNVIENENLQQNALEMGQHIVDGLNALAGIHDVVGDVRGNGLFIAVELVTDRDERTPATDFARQLVNDLRDRGVLTGLIGPDNNILKLRPPMVLQESDADFMLGILDESLTSVATNM